MIHTTAFTIPIELPGTYYLVNHLNEIMVATHSSLGGSSSTGVASEYICAVLRVFIYCMYLFKNKSEISDWGLLSMNFSQPPAIGPEVAVVPNLSTWVAQPVWEKKCEWLANMCAHSSIGVSRGHTHSPLARMEVCV